jgi:hypothetical protein
MLKNFKSGIRQMLDDPTSDEDANFAKAALHWDNFALLAQVQNMTPSPVEEVPRWDKVQPSKVARISGGHSHSLVHENLVSKLPSLSFLVDSGSSHHLIRDQSKFSSLQPCRIPIGTAKTGEVLWAKGVGDIRVNTCNVRGDPETLILRNALYVPDVQRDIVSCNALLKDNYQVILPSHSEANLFPAGIHNCRSTPFSPSAAIPIHQVGSLYYVKAFEGIERYKANGAMSKRSSTTQKHSPVWRGRR